MIQDDRTKYDIGEAFISIRIPSGTISHTPKGIVISLDSGTRYTCSYSRLTTYLKGSCKNYDQFVEETNMNDIVDNFKAYVDKLSKRAEHINKQLIEK